MKITVDVNLEKGTVLSWILRRGGEDCFCKISEAIVVGKKVLYKTDNLNDYKNKAFRTESEILYDYEIVIVL